MTTPNGSTGGSGGGRPQGGSGSNRRDRQNRRDHDRRTTSTATRKRRRRAKVRKALGPGWARLTGRGGSGSKRKPRARTPRKKPGTGTAIWGGISSLTLTAALLFQTFSSLMLFAATLAATAAAGWIESRQPTGPTGPPPRKTPPRQPKPRTSGTPPRQPRPGSSGSGGRGAQCVEACKRSKLPKSKCKCRHPKCQHGSKAGAK